MRVRPAPQPQRIDRQEAEAAVRAVVRAVVPRVPEVFGAIRVLPEVKGREQVPAEAKIREAKVVAKATVAKATAAKAQQARAVANRADPEVKAAGFGSSG